MRWILDKRNHTLSLMEDGQWIYEIDLEHCNSSAAICDWIFQVAHKQYASKLVMADLIFLLDKILQPQKYFCSWEIEKIIDHKDMAKFLTEQYKKMR